MLQNLERTVLTASSTKSSSQLTNIDLSIASDGKASILPTGVLTNRSIVDSQAQRDVTIVGELSSSCKANFTSPIDSSALDVDIVAVFDENGIVAIASEIDISDLCAARLADACCNISIRFRLRYSQWYLQKTPRPPPRDTTRSMKTFVP